MSNSVIFHPFLNLDIIYQYLHQKPPPFHLYSSKPIKRLTQPTFFVVFSVFFWYNDAKNMGEALLKTEI